jgi:hypothetical protein
VNILFAHGSWTVKMILCPAKTQNVLIQRIPSRLFKAAGEWEIVVSLFQLLGSENAIKEL